jgi:hypothetical protein
MFNSHSNGVWDTSGNQLQLPGRKEIVEWVTTAYRSLQAAEQVCTEMCCSVQESYSYTLTLPEGSGEIQVFWNVMSCQMLNSA